MKKHLLEKINNPEDLKKLSVSELPLLAVELRNFIIDIVSVKEGHLGASLGVVELTIALHYVFDTPDDLLVWDVGHQAYGHKILTGRKETFHTNRQKNGISGFPKRSESNYDAFGTGHSSTAVSAVLGMAIASKLKRENHRNHIAVVGDASIVSGMAFEGLNHSGISDVNMLIVLNDNAIGIDPSVGAFKHFLTSIKESPEKNQPNIFTSLNINYSGPIDGHNIPVLVLELERLKRIKGVKILHIVTTKGKGLQKAEENQVTYHSPGKFDKNTGEIFPKNQNGLPPKFQDVFGITLLELARKNEKIIGITPAMPTGSSLKLMMDEIPQRAFDVGIAEQHAVTLSAGMATQGMTVYCNIYSTFLQRAYDQIIHDVALQRLPVIFCLDRAGLVGEDGATHHGNFDLAYLRCIPNIAVFAPLNEIELRNILYTVQLETSNPIAIRYPRGRGVCTNWQKSFEKIEIGKAIQLKKGNRVAVLSTGFIGNNVNTALTDTDFAHYHFGFVKPLDKNALHHIFSVFEKVITVEEGTIKGGFGSAVLEFASENNYQIPVKTLGIPDRFIGQGSIEELQQECGIDIWSLKQYFSLQ
ncbi:MAG: 1-deoxy-D-xylulose-5-phosphate synthase [Flavobacteriaceae bacterium]